MYRKLHAALHKELYELNLNGYYKSLFSTGISKGRPDILMFTESFEFTKKQKLRFFAGTYKLIKVRDLYIIDQIIYRPRVAPAWDVNREANYQADQNMVVTDFRLPDVTAMLLMLYRLGKIYPDSRFKTIMSEKLKEYGNTSISAKMRSELYLDMIMR